MQCRPLAQSGHASHAPQCPLLGVKRTSGSPAELIEERQRRVDEMNGLVALPKGTTARQALEMEMRGEVELTPRQHNAAKILIEYQEPRLSAVAVGHMDGTSFAAALERCLARSEQARQGTLPPALPAPVQHPASEVRGNLPLRRRNFR